MTGKQSMLYYRTPSESGKSGDLQEAVHGASKLPELEVPGRETQSPLRRSSTHVDRRLCTNAYHLKLPPCPIETELCIDIDGELGCPARLASSKQVVHRRVGSAPYPAAGEHCRPLSCWLCILDALRPIGRPFPSGASSSNPACPVPVPARCPFFRSFAFSSLSPSSFPRKHFCSIATDAVLLRLCFLEPTLVLPCAAYGHAFTSTTRRSHRPSPPPSPLSGRRHRPSNHRHEPARKQDLSIDRVFLSRQHHSFWTDPPQFHPHQHFCEGFQLANR